MRFPPHVLDEIRARLPVSQVVGRRVALKKAGREWKGLSPFKAERTPSFFVNDQKGFYKCFASGEFGDIFTFVMKTEGYSFTEAVERLAQEAGIALPAPEPRSEKAVREHDERTRLLALLEQAAVFFEMQLGTRAGQEARAYLERRGVGRATIERFRLGYAPAGRGVLKAHLAGLGYSVAEMVAAGMLIAGEDIPEPYDRFRDRVMFPIQDEKGRVVAFGGRALSKDAAAKYLNSPETPLFHKGSLLYNAHRARQPAFEAGRLLVVEGYMDVLALDQAGLTGAVAPLGTALTEAQLQWLWRVVEEPVLCFDGDSAGRKAAFRAVDVALPALKPGHSLKFVFLPGGLDPDDLFRQQGPEALKSALARTVPLFDVLWQREQEAHPLITPEQRAAFEQRLKTQIGRIGEPTVRSHYQQQLKATLWTWGREAARSLGSNPAVLRSAGAALDWRIRERARERAPTRVAKAQRFASNPHPARPVSLATTTLGERDLRLPVREALILRALLNHPWLMEEHAERIARLEFTAQGFAALRDGLLEAMAAQIPLDRIEVRDHLTRQGLSHVVALVERAITHQGDQFAKPETDKDAVSSGWCHAVSLHEKSVGLARDLALAEERWLADQSEDAFVRLCEIKSLQHGIERVD